MVKFYLRSNVQLVYRRREEKRREEKRREEKRRDMGRLFL